MAEYPATRVMDSEKEILFQVGRVGKKSQGSTKTVVNVMGIPTVVTCIGDVVNSDTCVIVIPGNPGIIEFYDVFVSHLHEYSGRKLPIIGVAQAGHSPVWDYESNVDAGRGNYVHLHEQISHKLEFIRQHVPPEKRLIIMGHSIGAYIGLKLLEHEDVLERTLHSMLIFPAIERLAETPNGQFWDPISRYFRLPFALAAWMLSWTPRWVKDFLVAWRAKGRPVNQTLIKACHSCVCFSLMNNALYMAASEMDHVRSLDDDMASVISKNSDKLTFYYGAEDKWAPVDYYSDLKRQFPNADIRLCKEGYPHDFVLDSSAEMAEVVYRILLEKKLGV